MSNKKVKIRSSKTMLLAALQAAALLLAGNAMASTGVHTPPPYVYYKGGDGTGAWKVMERTVPVIPPAADPTGATITEIYDGTKGHDVLKLDGDGTNNSYSLTSHGDAATYECDPLNRYSSNKVGCIGNNMQKELTIQVKSSEMFHIYLYIDTPESRNYGTQAQYFNQYNTGLRVLEFTPTNASPSSSNWTDEERRYYSWGYNDHYSSTYDTSNASWSEGKTYHYGLGSDKMNGNWHTVSIDILGEAQRVDPGIDDAHLVGLEIRGDVRIDRVSLDWRSEELDLYENFDPDPDWAYDTGWLDMHAFGEFSTGKVDCLPESGGYKEDCKTLDEQIPSCKSIIREKKAVLDIDLSDLPQAQMDDCYFMLMAGYTWKDSLHEGVQDHEDLLIEVDAGGLSTSSVILDPGEGMHKVRTVEPLTVKRGSNKVTFRSPGFCEHGHSIHFGYNTRYGLNPFGFEYQANKTFRIQCGAGPSALDLNMDANPAVINIGQNSTINWVSQNAKACDPVGGYHDGTDNDWQLMAPSWSDLQTANPSWPSFAGSFITNPLSESVNYTLTCENETQEKYITRSAKVSVLGTCYNQPNCNDFVWDRVRSRNDAGNHYKDDDPTGHPAGIFEINSSNNVVSAPAADSEVSFEAAYSLTAGSHMLYIHARDTGVYWDKFIITNDMDYVPVDSSSGYGTNGVEGGKAKVELEGELAKYVGSSALERPDRYTASASRSRLVGEYWLGGPDYVYGLSSSVDGGASDHLYYYAGYEFNVPVADDYTIWGRFSSKDAVDANSVWIAVDPTVNASNSPNNRYHFILWEFPTVVNCCLQFDFAAVDPVSSLRSNAITVKTGEAFDLVWATGNMHSIQPSMGPGDYDDQWVGAAYTPKDASEVPIVPDPPNPTYHKQTITAPAIGTYVYQLQGYYGEGDYTEKKSVTVDVASAVPPNIPGTCGHVCNQETCLEPHSGFCGAFNTMLNFIRTETGWEWDCRGTDGTITHCVVERNCGWKERT